MITQIGNANIFTGATVRLVYDDSDLVTVLQGTIDTETGTEHYAVEFDTTEDTFDWILNETLDYSTLSYEEIELLLSSYNAWEVGVSVVVGQKLKYNNVLYEVLQAHTTQSDWTPDVADSLFAEVAPLGTIMEWVQPTGAHDAYNTGDQVTYIGHVWESTIDANIWSPSVYPQGWTDLGKY